MTSKHSPGPWSFQNHGSQILDARSGSSQTLVAKVEVNTYRDEGRYNALLISAAPELLAGYEAIKNSIQQARVHGNDWRRELALIENTVDAAIAKATGAA